MATTGRPSVRRLAPALLVGGLLALTAGSLPLGAQPSKQKADAVSVIVTLKDQAALTGITGATKRQRSEKLIHTLQDKASSTQQGLVAFLEAHQKQGSVSEYSSFWVFNGLAVTATPELVGKLAHRPEVLKVTPDATLDAPTEAAASTPESNIALVRAPDLWALGYTGAGTVVASMDTGVQGSHPDLASQWRGGSNSWFDPNGQHPSGPFDASGHGTRTMGVMVGRDGGGTAVGVAPDAQWIAVKIFDDSGSALTSRVHQGFQWLLDPDGNPATGDAPNVVNNSWTQSGAGCNLEYQLDLQALRAAEIVPVFAAGNYGPSASTSRSPANIPEAFAVGASTKTDGIWSQSSRGPSSCADTDPTYPELVAPGASIRTTDRFSGYVTVSGTSLAAPHVTGALALLIDAHAGATTAQLETALESTGVDLGAAGPDTTFGYGRLDAYAASTWLGAAPPDFTVAASPSSASTVQGGAAGYTVAVSPQGGFTADVSLSVAGLPAGASASFAPALVTGGSGTSELTVTTAASTPVGSYQLIVTGTGGATAHSTIVTLQVNAPPDFALSAAPTSATVAQGGNAGYVASVSSLNGFDGDVALSVGGLPAGTTATFDPATVVAAGTSQLDVSTGATTPAGSYQLTISGVSGALVHTAAVTLVVSALPQTQIAYPTSVTVQTGSYRSGAVADLATEATGYYEVNAATKKPRVAAWYGTFSSVPNSLSSLGVTYKGKSSSSCTQTVAIWNWGTSTWSDLDSRAVGTTDVLLADLAPSGALGDYVSGTTGTGSARVRIRCSGGSSGYYVSGNLLRLDFS